MVFRTLLMTSSVVALLAGGDVFASGNTPGDRNENPSTSQLKAPVACLNVQGLASLPREMLGTLMQYLNPQDFKRLTGVSRALRDTLNDQEVVAPQLRARFAAKWEFDVNKVLTVAGGKFTNEADLVALMSELAEHDETGAITGVRHVDRLQALYEAMLPEQKGALRAALFASGTADQQEIFRAAANGGVRSITYTSGDQLKDELKNLPFGSDLGFENLFGRVDFLVADIKANPNALRRIKKLDLSENDIGITELNLLIPALSKMLNLTLLDLTYNNIDSETGKALEPVLENLKKLEKLVLCSNQIGGAGAKDLVAVCNKLEKFTTLDITYNNLWFFERAFLQLKIDRINTKRPQDRQIDIGSISLLQYPFFKIAYAFLCVFLPARYTSP